MLHAYLSPFVVQSNIHKLVSVFPYRQPGNRLFYTAIGSISCPEGSDRQRKSKEITFTVFLFSQLSIKFPLTLLHLWIIAKTLKQCAMIML